MALMACPCGCRFAVGLLRCPQCGGADYAEDGAPLRPAAAPVASEPAAESTGAETEVMPEPSTPEAAAVAPGLT